MLSGKRLDELRLGDLGDIVSKMPPTLQKDASIGQALDAMLADARSRKAYVIDTEGNLVGVVTGESVLELLRERGADRRNDSKEFTDLARSLLKKGVEQVIKRPRPVMLSTSMKEVLSIMMAEHIEDLPVVDEDYKLIGELIGSEMIRAFKLG